MEPFVGQIMLWPVPWVPQDWQLCDGTLLQVQQYEALYSLIGNRYGGNGTTTFAVPDLRNRVPIGTVNMSAPLQTGGSPTSQINALGVGTVTLTTNNLPTHTHTATFNPNGSTATASIAIPAVNNANSGTMTDTPGTTVNLANSILPSLGDPVTIYSGDTPNTSLAPFNITVPAGGGTVSNGSTGGGQPFGVTTQINTTINNMQPFMAMNYIIALIGIYPPRP